VSDETTFAVPQPYDILGAEAFAQAWIQLLSLRPRQWWISAQQFDAWPLEQAMLTSALVAWSKAQPQGQVYVLAQEFVWVQAHAARFMQWRRLFAHQVMVKKWPIRLADTIDIPKGVYADREAIELGNHPTGQIVARSLVKPSQIAAQTNALQALWDKGQAALPAYTLGL
jgi:hypothetical protein